MYTKKEPADGDADMKEPSTSSGHSTRCSAASENLLFDEHLLCRALACHERAQRVEWRRRELNPRPEITLAPASTCLVDDLISCPPANVDILRRTPDVFISPLEQRPTQATSLLFSADLSQAIDRAETTYLIRQPLRTPERRNRRGRSHHCYWQLMFAQMINQAN